MPDRNGPRSDVGQQVVIGSDVLKEQPDLVKFLKLSSDRRLAEMRADGERAKASYEALKARVDAELLRLDPVHVLSATAWTFIVAAADDAPGRVPYLGQFHVELLQALLLRHPEEAYSGVVGTPEQVQTALDLVKDLAKARMAMPWADHPGPAADQAVRASVIETARMHTLAIRGDFYHEQLTRFFRPVLSKVSAAFQAVHGVAPERLLDLLLALANKMEQRLNDHFRALRRFYSQTSAARALWAYGESFPSTEGFAVPDIARVLKMVEGDARRLKYLLLCHSDLFVPDIFRLSVSDVEGAAAEVGLAGNTAAVVASMDALSMRFGNLAAAGPDRLFLDNPVWHRPLIREPDGWFWPSPNTTISFAPAIFYALAGRDDRLKSSFEAARAEVLEDGGATLLREAFPAARLWRGVRWQDPATGEGYENDTVLFLDGWLLVVEAKSGQLSGSARRGSHDRLKRDVKKLLADAAEQSARFVAYVTGSPGPVHLAAAGGMTCIIDPVGIDGVLRLAVTLDDMGQLSARGDSLRGSGLVGRADELVPTMNLSMLDVVVKALAEPSAVLHYLKRRTEFEQAANYVGDELDLLAFYLETGLNTGDAEFDDTFLMLFNCSKALDARISRLGDKPCSPQIGPITPFWERLLKRLAADRPEGWLDAALRLRNFTRGQQSLLERSMKAEGNKRRRRGHRAWVGHNGSTLRHEGFIVLVRGARHDPIGLKAELSEMFDRACQGSAPGVLFLYATPPVTAASVSVDIVHDKASLMDLIRTAEAY